MNLVELELVLTWLLRSEFGEKGIGGEKCKCRGEERGREAVEREGDGLTFPYPLRRTVKVLGVDIDWLLALGEQFGNILKKA